MTRPERRHRRRPRAAIGIGFDESALAAVEAAEERRVESARGRPARPRQRLSSCSRPQAPAGRAARPPRPPCRHPLLASGVSNSDAPTSCLCAVALQALPVLLPSNVSCTAAEAAASTREEPRWTTPSARSACRITRKKASGRDRCGQMGRRVTCLAPTRLAWSKDRASKDGQSSRYASVRSGLASVHEQPGAGDEHRAGDGLSVYLGDGCVESWSICG